MRAGKLRHLITIQHKVPTTGAMGTKVVTWANFLERVPAEYEPLRGRDFVAANQSQAELTAVFRIRYRSDIDADMRIVFDGEPFEIVGKPIDWKGRRQMLEIMCKAGVKDGKRL